MLRVDTTSGLCKSVIRQQGRFNHYRYKLSIGQKLFSSAVTAHFSQTKQLPNHDIHFAGFVYCNKRWRILETLAVS